MTFVFSDLNRIKWEISNNKLFGKIPNIWNFLEKKKTLQCDKDRISNLENEWQQNTSKYLNTAKTMLRGKLRDLNACIKKKKDLKINDLRFYSKKLQGGEQSKH